MRLSELTSEYIEFKQSMGMRFRTEAVILNAFGRAMGNINIADVAPDPVLHYLAGTGTVTAFWHRKFEALTGFYRFALSRGPSHPARYQRLYPNVQRPSGPTFTPMMNSISWLN